MTGVTAIDSINHPSKFESPSQLLQLPDEVQLEVLKHVNQRRDLFNFSLACRQLEQIATSQLYKSIELDVSDLNNSADGSGSPLALRPLVLESVRELVIKDDIANAQQRNDYETPQPNLSLRESCIDQLSNGVAQGRLRSFSLLQQTPLSQHMLDSLTERHGESLRHLRCYEFAQCSTPESSLPANLKSFECRSVLTGESIAEIVAVNRNTLESISLGQDKHLVQEYQQRRIGFLNQVPQPADPFGVAIDISMIPNLKHLSLSGLDLAALVPKTVESSLCLARLEGITIESCLNSEQFLQTLTETFTHLQRSLPSTISHSQRQISLRKFSFRHELFTKPLRDSVVDFLTCFSGLTSLTILTENANFTTRPATFLKPHSETLRSLVLESRIQPREELHIDTSRPQGTNASQTQLWINTFTDISENCPKLEELGIAIPWTDITVQSSAYHLSTLKNLKTLHIRNFPSQTHGPIGSDQLTEHAQNFLARCYSANNVDTTVHPALEHLAIGPTLHSTRWHIHTSPSSQGSSPASSIPPSPQLHPVLAGPLIDWEYLDTQPHQHPVSPVSVPSPQPTNPKKRKRSLDSLPEHLHTHHFKLDWTDNKAKVESVSERFVEDVRSEKPLQGIFEAVWLR